MKNHTNYKHNLIDEFNNNGFVILRNLVDNKKIKKLEDSLKTQILFHMNKHELNIEGDIFNQGIIQLNKIRKDKTNLIVFKLYII